jgi:hypothetical protein
VSSAASAGSTDLVSSLLQIALITGMLVGSFWALGLLQRWFSGDLEHQRSARRRAREGRSTRVAAPRRPIEAVAADVRRLARELAMVPSGIPQGKRLGLQAAYDDVLIEAATLLEIRHGLDQLPRSARGLERMRLVASLEAAGLVLDR